MINLDYEELGFRCGIEIHQRLDTDTKLFCSCPTELVDREADGEVNRFLRPVPGESGEVDRAARFEFLQDREFTYNIYNGVSCLVELDEEPPHPIDGEAMETALQVALMFECSMPDEIHVMRKTVIDGSNTAGFQRTALIGLDGEISTEKGSVGIEDIELEEESAGISEEEDSFDLDRLGIPLIEIGTDDSISSPEHAKEVAKKIGMFLRSTENVKRGIGSIRQDVNVSIEGGARVEVKGFQDVEGLDKLVKNEVERQKSLIEIKQELEESGIDPEKPEIVEVTEVFKGCGNDIIEPILEDGGKVYASLVPLEGLMNKDLCEGLTLGSELAGYAGSHGIKGIIHTDEDISGYGLEEEFKSLSEVLDKSEGWAIVVAAGEGSKARKALDSVLDRALMCFEKVPEETRDAEPDFTTTYSRPLPGSARMYPETDIPPFVLDSGYIEEIREDLPDTLEEKRERLTESVGEQLADQLVSSGKVSLFDRLSESTDTDPKTVANLLVNVVSDVESRNDVDTGSLSFEDFKEILDLFAGDEIGKDALPVIVKEIASDPSISADEVVEERDLGAMGVEEVREVVKEVLDEKQELIEEKGEHARGALMGVVMGRVEGKADGSVVNKVLSEELDRVL
ncbi:MAG: Glu-tRNA(Gln) amidotransferase subunit GatE [Candidatus Nanohaloarchaea archaeon]|nr:Glu-tRNA(Gln) amidotransferase subunit GatE [Candidatus Nanohaloarchaea archaeon]